MKTFKTFQVIFSFEIYENIRSRWLIFNTVAFFLFSSILIYYGNSEPLSVISSLLNLSLLILPLFSLLFGSISFIESMPYFEFILIRDVKRSILFLGKYLGISLGLSFSYIIGLGISYISILGFSNNLIHLFSLLSFGVLLIFLFIAISFLLSILIQKKELLYGFTLFCWFYFYILYDLLIIAFSVLYRDYPLEIPILILVFLNPIDLVRIATLLQFKLSNLMGFGTALFQKVLGDTSGFWISIFCLSLWICIPLFIAYKKFLKKDL